ncbi:MAG TPA: FAD binding domain-containing protein [Pseudonocardia sp.]|jgi:carbon-monoxide dehydrogenase medium subunit|uniref:FAD binding domain-containing protein n=1 Tax=Pseudonocardia sp. TaxID=60912 RepID=UPI002B4B25B2|nr:FAD binding domain-containing protein [Pseudonocardia sp.]HLU58935.1 FAD binding domain-containing protein [Pseudonocardia sp.]
MTAPVVREPGSTREACALLAADPWGTKVVSGGTALVLMMRQGLVAPQSLVALWRIPGLAGITRAGDVLRIGATTTLAEVAASPLVRSVAPSLAHACSVVGNPRIRNVATLGGNLAEADYASDPPAALASLGARCHATGPDGTREIPVRDLVTGFYETVLDHAELITHVDVPIAGPGRRATYLKYRTRSSEDRPCVGVAARLDADERGRVRELDVVVAAVAPTLHRVPAALDAAAGRAVDDALAGEVARSYAEAVEPLEDARGSAWYRRRMVEVLVRRAVQRFTAPEEVVRSA